jgi:hypothetical protein
MVGKLHVTDSDGNYLPGFPVDTNNPVEATPILVDMDNDGNIDIVYGDSEGFLHAINIQGEECDSFPINLKSALNTTPTIGYAKNNDVLAILVPNQNGYNFIDYKLPIGEIVWGTFKGNERRSGNYDDMLSTKKYEESVLPAIALKGNFPNPFNPETTISFTLNSETKVDLKIYNIRGQVVKTLLNNTLNHGEHRVVWDGKDDQGAQVGSGVYLYSFTAGEHKESRKMMLLK